MSSALSDQDQEILDAINQGSFTYAQAQLHKKLAQYPNKSYYWALQNLYLYSTGQYQQCLTKSIELQNKVPSDPTTLKLLHEIFTKLNQPVHANQVFENALKKYPSNAVVLAWFAKCVETFDTKSLQKALLQMSKLNKNHRLYTHWAAFGYLLLSDLTTTPKEQNLYQTLALKLMAQFTDDDNVTNQESFILAQIYQQRDEFRQIVLLIDSLPAPQIDLDLTIVYCNALYKTQQFAKLYSHASHLLFEQNFNDFDTWRYWIESAHNLKIPFDDAYQQIKLTCRNSYLAFVHLEQVYQGSNQIHASVSKYWHQFKTKPCVVVDLQNYINNENKSSVLQPLISEVGTNDDPACLVNAFKLTRLYQLEMPLTSLTELFRQHRDNTHVIDYLLLNIIEDIAKPTTTQHQLIDKIIILEYLHSKDPQNFKIGSWLINLYSLVNCSSLSLHHYHNLKIKMIQHDTQSFKINHHLSPNVSNLNQLIEIFKFYLTAEWEINENITKAFNHGIFNKLQDFLTFGDNLHHSISKHLVVIEILKISRILNNDYLGYFTRFVSNFKFVLANDGNFAVTDNRDSTTDTKFTSGLVLFDSDTKTRVYPSLMRSGDYVKLCYLKELIVVETDADLLAKLYKQLNKVVSDPQVAKVQLTAFENWLFKIYLHFFKIFKIQQTKPSETTTLINYLSKNLKFDKVVKFIGQSSISWQWNHVLTNVYDFVKISNKINNSSHPGFNKSISHLTNQLLKDCVAYKPVHVSVKKSMDEEYVKSFVDDDGFISKRVDEIDDALKKSVFKFSK